MKKLMVIFAIFAAPAFAQERCEHVELLLWEYLDNPNYESVKKGPGYEIFKDKEGRKWKVTSDGEEACVVEVKK